MKLTDALLGEHGVIYALFDHVEKGIAGCANLKELQQLTHTLAAALVSHARIEEELLFSALEARTGPMGPLAMMLHEHQEIDRAIDGVAKADDYEEALERLRYGLGVARNHFAKEEHILFNLAQEALSGQQLEELGEQWANLRRVAIG